MSTQLSADPVSPSEAVFTEVAQIEDADPLELDPLAETIDPDALDRLLSRGDVEIVFTYQGYDVRITADGEVDVLDSGSNSFV